VSAEQKSNGKHRGWKEGVVKREIRDGVFEFFANAIK
jgi:hypothetical protein